MELLKRFRHGDGEAFEALFTQFQREVYGWIVRIVRDLWPAMAQMIESRHAEGVGFDWAVAGVAGSLLAVFPELILVVVYHL